MNAPHPRSPSLLTLMWTLGLAIWGWAIYDMQKWRRGFE